MKKILAFSLICMFFFQRNLSINSYANDGNFVYGRDTWFIWNYPDYFSDTYSQDLFEEHKETLRKNLSNTEWYVVNRFINSEWSGNCYGFSITSVLACYDLLNPDDYYDYTDNWIVEPYDGGDLINFHGNYTTKEYPNYIEQSILTYYQMTCMTEAYRQESVRQQLYMTHGERLQHLISCVEDGKPTVLDLAGYFNGADQLGGHAVTAYGVEYGTYEVNDEIYTGKVLIYDSNNGWRVSQPSFESMLPMFQMYFRLEDASWYIPAYELSSDNGYICAAVNDIDLLNDKGLLEGTKAYLDDHPYIDVLTVNQLQSEGKVYRGELTEQGYTINPKSDDLIVKMEAPLYVDGSLTTEVNYYMDGEETGYAFCVNEPQELLVHQYYRDSIQSVSATSAVSTAFAPSGFVTMTGDNTAYTLEMVWNEGFYTGSWYDFSVSGTSDTASLQKTEKGYLLTSDNLQNITVTAKNDDVQTKLTFSTDADSVLLCEVNQTTLAAKIDTDGDGTYETELTADTMIPLGDINTDGSVDASDAADILTVAAVMGSGVESDLTEAQLAAADINADDMIDAIDAAFVLQYAAHIGAGTTIMLEEYLSQIQIQKV